MSEVLMNNTENSEKYTEALDTYMNLKYEGLDSLNGIITAKNELLEILTSHYDVVQLSQIRDHFSDAGLLLSGFQKLRMYEISASISNHIKNQNFLGENSLSDSNIQDDVEIS